VDPFERLRAVLGEVEDLRRSAAVLSWDHRTVMPPRGERVRAEQLATLSRVAHERFTDPEVGRLLDDLRGFEEAHEPESFEASFVRVARADYEKAVRVPSELRAEIARAGAQGYEAWVRAKEVSDFALFLPALERALELKRRYVKCFDAPEEPYDVLLDDFERGMPTAVVRRLFDELKAELPDLARAAADPDAPRLEGDFDVGAQRELALEAIELFGLRAGAWRLDATVHPFASSGGVDDIRITTFYHPRDLDSLFATMHEYGHALYEHQVDALLDRSPLGSGVSLGLHESQSRLWENLVGRSRAFWTFFRSRVAERFPDLRGWTVDDLYRAVNRVEPSLIRIHADEITYSLHIVLRFELEQELLAGTVEPRQLPEVWNEHVRRYLGIEVPDDAHGVLQDTHWSLGYVGYFPTYALGNIMSAQIWEAARADLPDLDERMEGGDFASLREWLGERLHRHGRKLLPAETLERVAGGPIETGPYLRYLRAKHLSA
jgi:carboxypeptidase Taq